MKSISTSISIYASPQTVWSVVDDLVRYPEWNPLTPDLSGRTTVGSRVRGTLVKPQSPAIPLSPTITVTVAAREFRWLSQAPDQSFRAEHYFLLAPTEEGGTALTHAEDFDGPAWSDPRGVIHPH